MVMGSEDLYAYYYGAVQKGRHRDVTSDSSVFLGIEEGEEGEDGVEGEEGEEGEEGYIRL